MTPMETAGSSVTSASSSKTSPVDQGWSCPRARQGCPRDPHFARGRSPFRRISSRSRISVCPSPSRYPVSAEQPESSVAEVFELHSPFRGKKRMRYRSRSPVDDASDMEISHSRYNAVQTSKGEFTSMTVRGEALAKASMVHLS